MQVQDLYINHVTKQSLKKIQVHSLSSNRFVCM